MAGLDRPCHRTGPVAKSLRYGRLS